MGLGHSCLLFGVKVWLLKLSKKPGDRGPIILEGYISKGWMIDTRLLTKDIPVLQN